MEGSKSSKKLISFLYYDVRIQRHARHLLLLTGLFTLAVLNVFALCSQTSTRTASTFTDDGSNGGARAWNNPSNAALSDNVRATSGALLLGQKTHYLRAENFGFNIPVTATICGFEITIEKSAAGLLQNVVDDEVKIIKGGIISGTNLGFDDVWGTSDAMAVHGNTYETSGLTWTPAHMNASNFGVAISVNLGGISVLPTARIDYISITVYYTYSPLPIQLLEFSAQCFRNAIRLDWSTASEWNNAYFTIERSSDGNNWTVLDSVRGMGTSDILHNYSWTDEEPEERLAYYRLCQHDFDATLHYFTPVAIRNHCFAEGDEILIYPNPVKENICFRYTAKESFAANIKVISEQGVTLLEINDQINFGLNRYCYSTTGLESGRVYFFKISSSNHQVTARFLK